MITVVFTLYLIFIIYIAIGLLRLHLRKAQESPMADEKVTVVMAVKNEAKTIQNCLCFFLNQTYKNVEFIIVDDNSSDETASFVQKSALFSTGRLRLVSAVGYGKKTVSMDH